MKRQVFLHPPEFQNVIFCFVFEKTSLLHMQLVMLFVQVGKQHKRKNSQKQLFTDVLQNSCSERFFLNIVKKTTVLESPFNKVAGLKVCIFIKKQTPTQLFSCQYCEILNNSFFIEHLRTLGTKLIFFIFLVSLLCFSS